MAGWSFGEQFVIGPFSGPEAAAIQGEVKIHLTAVEALLLNIPVSV